MSNIRIELESGASIELSETQTLAMELNNPVLNLEDDQVAGSFSWPVTVPATGANKRALGWPERLESASNFGQEQKGTLHVAGLAIPCLVTIKKASPASYSLQVMAGASIVSKKLSTGTLRDMDWGGDKDWFEGYSTVKPRAITSSGHYATWQATFLNFLDAHNNVTNVEHFSPDGFCFGVIENEALGATKLNDYLGVGMQYWKLQPQLNVISIIKKIFSELDITVGGSMLTDFRLQNTILVSSGLWPTYSTPQGPCPDNIANLRDFLPHVSPAAFIKAICKTFFYGAFFDIASNRVDFLPLSNLPGGVPVADWTSKVEASTLSIEQEETAGLAIRYSHEKNDEIAAALCLDTLQDRNLQAQVADLPEFLSTAKQNEEVRFVVDEDLYFKLQIPNSGPNTAEILAQPLIPVDEQYERTWNTGSSTVWTRYDTQITPQVKFGVNAKLEAVRLLFYLGMIPDAQPVDTPTLSHKWYDVNKNPIGPGPTLLLHGTGGLVAARGKGWLDFLARQKKKLTVKVRLTEADILRHRFQNKVRIGSVEALVAQLKPNFPIKGLTEASLYIT